MSENLMSDLIEAVVKNLPQEVASYLALGADANGWIDKSEMRPLHYAVSWEALEAAEVLIEAGGDPYLEDWEGYSAFSLAYSFKSKPFISLFQKCVVPCKSC